MTKCQYNEVMDGDAEDCESEIEIWATYPLGCPGDLWYGLCFRDMIRLMREDLVLAKENTDGATFGMSPQLVSYVDPSTLPNHGFPQYGEINA
jgi:hypothetical protein